MRLHFGNRMRSHFNRAAAWKLAVATLGATYLAGPSDAHAQPIPALLMRPEAAVSAGSEQGRVAGDARELRARQQALLDLTRRNPTDYEATYAYVAVSTQLHDNEAAIGALERLLYYNPRLARANYELGVLYFQLGSYDAAARYLRAAAASPALEPATQARIEALYPEAVKQQGQSRWFGFLQLGLRYQTNATFVPSNGIVRLNGQDFLLAPGARRRPDGSGFGLAQLGNDYDLQNQRGDVLETRLLGFGSVQFRASEFDFGYLEASFGPRFGLPELMAGSSIKPYIVGQTSALRGERSPYVSSGGAGVTMRLPVGSSVTLEPGVEMRALSVSGHDSFSASTFDSGRAVSGYLLSTAKLTDDIALEARFVGIRADSKQPWQSFDKAGWSLALNFQFDPPSELIPRKWKISPFIGAAIVDFDRANPLIDPLVVRRDREFSTGVVLDAPLTAAFAVSATVQYNRIDSNLPNYRQRDLTVLGGPTARF
jgi:hypothetical protein